MKRVLSAILVIVFLFALAACGEQEVDLSDAVLRAAGTDAQVQEDGSATPSAAPAATSGTVYTANLFTVTYPSDAGWVIDEEDCSDYESDSSLVMYIPGSEDGKNAVTVRISADVEDHHSFRSDLRSAGFDLETYAANGYEFTNVGGVDCVFSDNAYWGETAVRYFGRDTACQTTVSAIAHGDIANYDYQSVFDGIEFVLNANDEVEAPWPWEGTAYEPAAYGPQTLGSVTLTPTFLKASAPIMTYETFDHSIAVIGDQLYVLSAGVLNQYVLNGDGVTFVQEIELPEDDYERIEADSNGVLHISGFMNNYIGLKDGQQVFSYDGVDNVAISPSGSWGISYFYSGECKKIDMSVGTPVITDFIFNEIKSLSWVQVTDEHILVSGYSVEDDDQYVFVYDFSGTLLKRLAAGDDNWIGSITYVIETGNGILAMDGNMRCVHIWDAQGNYLGAAKDSDLFGTDYPSFAASCITGNGIYTLMVDERADESADEIIFFRVLGI